MTSQRGLRVSGGRANRDEQVSGAEGVTSSSPTRQVWTKVSSRIGMGMLGHLLGGSGHDDVAACVSAFGTQIDNPCLLYTSPSPRD